MYIACRKETTFIKGNYIIILHGPLFLEFKSNIKSVGSEQSRKLGDYNLNLKILASQNRFQSLHLYDEIFNILRIDIPSL